MLTSSLIVFTCYNRLDNKFIPIGYVIFNSLMDTLIYKFSIGPFRRICAKISYCVLYHSSYNLVIGLSVRRQYISRFKNF